MDFSEVGPRSSDGGDSLPVDNRDIVACLGRTDCFLCGDVRCNEQVSLTIMHTLWVREHNRIARELQQINPQLSDETLYQEARKIIGAIIQKIVYFDYLPKVLGPKVFNIVIGQFERYDPEVDASVPIPLPLLPTDMDIVWSVHFSNVSVPTSLLVNQHLVWQICFSILHSLQTVVGLVPLPEDG